METATIFVSNWGSHATQGMHGPGRKWTIMALPRSWERGDGVVRLFVPDSDDVRAARAGDISTDEYRARFLRLIAGRVRYGGHGLLPGSLEARTPAGSSRVVDGDTLLCACGVEKARAGGCHRTWAAAFLAVAGWSVVLDGRPLEPGMVAGLALNLRADTRRNR